MTSAPSADERPERTAVRARAHAKLTLSLRVIGDRGDGYHELEALTCSLDRPHDLVEIALTTRPEIELQVARAAPGPDEAVPRDGTNLAAVAARSLLRRVEPGAGARLRLKKLVPTGAGLGGGSADAAAVLLAVARLLPLETAGVDLVPIAAAVGSDVPFCLTGGLAWMRGRGEEIEPLAAPDGVALVLATPTVAVSTADVYRAWDGLGAPASDRAVPAPAALRPFVDTLVNDLEPAALSVAPGLEGFRDRLEAVAGAPPVLAGSGSTYFVACPPETADDLAAEVGAALAPDARYVGRAGVVDRGVSWLDS